MNKNKRIRLADKANVIAWLILIAVISMVSGCGRRVKEMKETEVKNEVLNSLRSNYFGTDFTEFEATVTSIDSSPKEGYTYANLDVSLGDGYDTKEMECKVYFTLDENKEWRIETMDRTVAPLDQEMVQNFFEDHVSYNYEECGFTECTVNSWIEEEDDSADYGYANVKASVYATNDNVSMDVDYSGSYYLDRYNHWQIDDVTVEDGNYILLTSDLTEDDAMEAMGQDEDLGLEEYEFIELKSHETDLDYCKDVFTFSAKEWWNGADRDRTLKVQFRYDLYDGWRYAGTDVSGDGIVDLSSGKSYRFIGSVDSYYR